MEELTIHSFCGYALIGSIGLIVLSIILWRLSDGGATWGASYILERALSAGIILTIVFGGLYYSLS